MKLSPSLTVLRNYLIFWTCLIARYCAITHSFPLLIDLPEYRRPRNIRDSSFPTRPSHERKKRGLESKKSCVNGNWQMHSVHFACCWSVVIRVETMTCPARSFLKQVSLCFCKAVHVHHLFLIPRSFEI